MSDLLYVVRYPPVFLQRLDSMYMMLYPLLILKQVGTYQQVVKHCTSLLQPTITPLIASVYPGAYQTSHDILRSLPLSYIIPIYLGQSSTLPTSPKEVCHGMLLLSIPCTICHGYQASQNIVFAF